jgi:hypothetical protein
MVMLSSCTVSGNSAPSGGGVYLNGCYLEVTAANTIIANATPGQGCAADHCRSRIAPHGYNLDDDGSCGFANVGDLSDVADFKRRFNRIQYCILKEQQSKKSENSFMGSLPDK